MAIWQPDDSFLNEDANHIRQGVKTVKQALRNHGVDDSKIYTSKDAAVVAALADTNLARTMPNGFEQSMIPVVLHNRVVVFTTSGPGGQSVPSHSHNADLFRVITSGTAIYNGISLSAGDWMFVPANEAYSLEASSNPGYIGYHVYG